MLSRGNVVPIPGTSSVERLKENVGAANVRLGGDEIEELDAIVPKGAAVGDRYHASGMDLLNR